MMIQTTMNTRISAAGGIETYENYIYINSADSNITHANAFFTKPICDVGTSGGILFENDSLTPKELEFTITAQNGTQNYKMPCKMSCLNLHLNSEKKITGTSNGTVIRFKTVNDYMADKLMPIAEIVGTNYESEFIIQYDRDITDAIVLVSDSVVNPTSSLSGKNITIKVDSASHGGYIIYRVTFGDVESFGNTYDYTAIYDKDLKWYIK